MKAFRTLLALGVLAATVALAVEKVGLDELFKETKKFDGKVIETSGEVADFKQKTSRAGNKYFTFSLIAGEKVKVSVYSQGEADTAIKDGAKVKVVGIFREEKKVQDFVVKNEIDATKKKDKPNGVSILPKG